MSKVLGYVLPFLALPGLASAQSSLGLNLARATVQASPDVTAAEAQIDILFTPYHGLQGDLGLSRYDDTSIGHIAGHLYLSTDDTQKYGVFGAYHDWDDASISAISAGVEGLWAIGPNAALGFQAGLGKMDPGKTDFVFASLNWAYEVSSDLKLTASATLTDVDETAFSTTAQSYEFAAKYRISSPTTLTAGLRHVQLSGTHYRSTSEAFIALNIEIGRNASPVRSTAFRSPQPLRAYWQQDLLLR